MPAASSPAMQVLPVSERRGQGKVQKAPWHLEISLEFLKQH
jgi:hypothetical protein